ncbi:hypothetical protein, partial [Xanthomonas euvesicatoria]|uniref:hypothetical protein n=1 Tax=Xanthomonas euvesicatoria TaxID=456327 RepID=UPI0023588CB9
MAGRHRSCRRCVGAAGQSLALRISKSSTCPNPESRIPNPESRIPNPESAKSCVAHTETVSHYPAASITMGKSDGEGEN